MTLAGLAGSVADIMDNKIGSTESSQSSQLVEHTYVPMTSVGETVISMKGDVREVKGQKPSLHRRSLSEGAVREYALLERKVEELTQEVKGLKAQFKKLKNNAWDGRLVTFSFLTLSTVTTIGLAWLLSDIDDMTDVICGSDDALDSFNHLCGLG